MPWWLPRWRRPGWSGSVVLALVLAALAPVELAGGTLFVYQREFAGRIYPRITIAGIAVGGQTPVEAQATVEAYLAQVAQRPLELRSGSNHVSTSLGDLGLTPPADAARVVQRAWDLGRRPDSQDWLNAQWQLLRRGDRLPLDLGLDRTRARAALVALADTFNQPPSDAAVILATADGTYSLRVAPAHAGQTVDVDATLDRLEVALHQGVPEALDVVVKPIPPAVGDAAVAPAYALAATLLAGPATFKLDDAHRWEVPAATLATAIHIVPAAGDTPARAEIDPAKLAEIIAGVAAQADAPAQNPHLEVRGSRLAIQPGASGRLVDRQAALDTALAQFAVGSRTIQLPIREDRPWVSESDLAPVRDWVNARLALPLDLDYAGQRRTLSARELAAAFVLPDTQAIPRPTGGHAAVPVETHLDPARLHDLLAATIARFPGIDPSQAPADPALELHDHHVDIRPGYPGIGADLDALTANVANRFGATDPAARVVTVALAPRAPRVADDDLIPARDLANRLIGAPVVVHDAFQEWTITPDQLEAMLRFQESGGQMTAYLGRDLLLARVETLAREAEARTGGDVVRDVAGLPAKVDRLSTAAGIWAAAQQDAPEQRVAEMQWAI